MRTRNLAFLIPIWLCGCAAQTIVPATQVRVQRVEVPVAVPRKPPQELLSCWYHINPYRGYTQAKGGWLVPSSDTQAFTAYLSAHQACDARWRAWATAP